MKIIMKPTTRDLKRVVELTEKHDQPKVESSLWQCMFHLMPPVGWMNDPNGLCDFNGEHHIFFQYCPFSATGGIVFWGHYKTKDFIHYDYLPPAICPDESEDAHGAYSGSALIDNNKMYLYYTGNVLRLGDYDYIRQGREHNTILIESNDGKTFDNKRVVLTNADDKPGISCHMRDPKVWKEDGVYYMVQGARSAEDKGMIVLFRSHDKYHWEEINRLQTPYSFGYMWECPDYYLLDTYKILGFSPQGIDKQGYLYNNIYQSGYCFVQGDIKGTYSLSKFTEYDCGFDFYAPQTWETEDGRRILIGWMGLPNDEHGYTNPTVKDHWQHMLTVPRELSIKDGALCQTPVRELQKLRKQKHSFSIDDSFNYEDIDVFEADITHISGPLKVTVRNGACLEYHDGTFSLSFNETGFGRDKRCCHLDHLEHIKILCDVSSVEIFLNGGEKVFTSRFYPKDKTAGIFCRADLAQIDIYELSPFKIKKYK